VVFNTQEQQKTESDSTQVFLQLDQCFITKACCHC